MLILCNDKVNNLRKKPHLPRCLPAGQAGSVARLCDAIPVAPLRHRASADSSAKALWTDFARALWRARSLLRALRSKAFKAAAECREQRDRGQLRLFQQTARGFWFVYVVRCRDGSLYTGITLDIRQRIAEHSRGQGSKYVRSRLPVRIVYAEKYTSKSKALKREYEIKCWSRLQKLVLIKRKGETL